MFPFWQHTQRSVGEFKKPSEKKSFFLPKKIFYKWKSKLILNGVLWKKTRLEAKKNTKNYFVINKRLSIEASLGREPTKQAREEKKSETRKERKYLKVYLKSGHKVIDWCNLQYLICFYWGINKKGGKTEMPLEAGKEFQSFWLQNKIF